MEYNTKTKRKKKNNLKYPKNGPFDTSGSPVALLLARYNKISEEKQKSKHSDVQKFNSFDENLKSP